MRYVLLSPLRRRDVLMGGALKSVRHAAFLGAVVGAVAGQLAGRRLGGSLWAWAGSGAATGGLIAASFVGAAMVACGVHLPRWAASLLGAGLLGWAVLDVTGITTCPTTTLGSLAFWPLRVQWIDLAGVVAVVLLVVVGLLMVGRVVAGGRRAPHRPRRPAALRRHPPGPPHRARPPAPAGAGPPPQPAVDPPRAGPPHPGLAAGLARRAALPRQPRRSGSSCSPSPPACACAPRYDGIPPLILVSGICFFLAGLEAAEPIAQDIDQSDRTDSVPVARGELLVRHLPAAWTVMALLGVLAGVVFWAVKPTTFAVELAAIVAVPAALCGGAGGIVSVLMGAPEPSKDGALLPPEVAGMKIFFRSAWPVIVAVLGSVPVARRPPRPAAHGRDRCAGQPARRGRHRRHLRAGADGVRRGLRAVPGPGAGSGSGR